MLKRRHPTQDPAAQSEVGFAREEQGSFIIFGLAVFMLMALAGGLAVDTMRYEAHRVHVQNTLDRAILAAASLDQPLDPETVVLDYFTKAGLGHLIDEDDVDVEATTYSRRVDAEISASMPTTFLRLAEMYALDMTTGGAAEEAVSVSEISLVVDVSGSMGNSSHSGNSKLYELKRAAKRFVNVMLCDPSDPDETINCTVDEGQISINIVPYAEQVLLGDDLLAYFNHTNEHSESTCITFYEDDFETVSIPTYAPADFAAQGRPLPIIFGDPVQLTGYFDPSSSSSRSANPGDRSPCYNDYSGSSTDAWREVHAFERSAATLRSELDSLKASGQTSIDLGMKWGAALLDPAVQPAVADLIANGDVHGDFEGRPFAYTQRGIEKIIVLMTDGQNTSQDYLREGFHSGLSPVWKANDTNDWSVYNAETEMYYWEQGQKWLDHPYGTGISEQCTRHKEYWGYYYWQYNWVETCEMVDEGSGATQYSFPDLWRVKPTNWYDRWNFLADAADYYGNSEKNNHLDDICTAAKNAGMTVFTIGFEVPDSQDAIMSNCASAPSYYFDVDGLDISAAFTAIAREISKLRLVY